MILNEVIWLRQNFLSTDQQQRDNNNKTTTIYTLCLKKGLNFETV